GITTEDGTDIIGPCRLISRTAGAHQQHGHHSKEEAGFWNHLSIIRISTRQSMYNFRVPKREFFVKVISVQASSHVNGRAMTLISRVCKRSNALRRTVLAGAR
ncbi:MAG TPA: hypothetical protein VMV87_13395, partial [Burkholderiales bacterium]|nr:hypothetical protein [Burkholderiales bacterium]